jgi:hypothetical protein
MTQASTTQPGGAAPDADDVAQEEGDVREVTRPLTAFVISIVFHAAILGILATITWVVVHQSDTEVVLNLGDGTGAGPGGGGGGGGSGDGTQGAAGAGAGNSAPKGAENVVAASAENAVPVPTPFADGAGAAALAAPTMPDGLTNASASAIDPALMAFGGGGMTTGLGGAGHGSGIGSGSGSGSGPGSGSGVGGGNGSGTGPGNGAGVGPGFGGVLDEMRTKGLDVVFVIDATASMLPYIEQSKQRLRQVVTVVNALVSGAKPAEGVTGKSGVRFGIVAFKDYGDEYGPEATRSLPLTTDIAKLQKAIDEIAAGGGADEPEPHNEALKAARSSTMGWSRTRKNVIVMITDAPCHSLTREQAMQEARAFAKGLSGQINVIDVGGVVQVKGEGAASTQPALTRARSGVLADLQGIAREGGGSAFLLQDDQAFWRHLIVSIFGQRFEQDVQQIIDTYVKPTAK